MEQTPKQQKRDEVMWQANKLAHAILGLDRVDESDPSGLKRKTALIALAREFLNLAGRKTNRGSSPAERTPAGGFPRDI
jgi:hypothetical protein